MGRDDFICIKINIDRISIHTPRVGRDRMKFPVTLPTEEFQSTRPVWGVTRSSCAAILGCSISIHTPRVGRDAGERKIAEKGPISIHTPRVGRDYYGFEPLKSKGISIHTPRVGRDRFAVLINYASNYFNPHAPCGA